MNMGFQLTDQHIDDFQLQGYTVFRKILPTSLIRDLRRVSHSARQIARDRLGSQAQRLQPVGNFDIDQQPFIDYAELPDLVKAIAELLSPHHQHGNRNHLGILIEPAEEPYCTPWHRDWRDNLRGMKLERWNQRFQDANLFNQINCALYNDNCTWLVPGSHSRHDLVCEIERFPNRPISGPNLKNKNTEEREQICLEYCRSMPSCLQLHLEAGDFALYRSSVWHIGNYVPYSIRATLHDSAMTPEFEIWSQQVQQEASVRREAGVVMDNPNINRL